MTNIVVMVSLLVFSSLVATAGAVFLWWHHRRRAELLRRALGEASGPAIVSASAPSRPVLVEIADWLSARVPAQFAKGEVSASRLTQAGFSRQSDQAVFALLRVISMVFFPTVALLVAPTSDPVMFTCIMVTGIGTGLVLPGMVLDQMVQSRQWAVRKAIPDALDVMVVCVEAGVALDASLQRVARELMTVHPVLSSELLHMTRRVAAGMPRDEALQSLYVRTGVDELRGLASHLLQSERWGTSIASVLRIYSEQVRQKRRVAAEKRAATASTRMLIPLMLFIFPTMFVVLLAPALLRINSTF